MRATASPIAVDDIAALRVEVQRLRDVVLAQGQRIAALEAARPRDVHDVALRRILPEATRGLPFSAAELEAHATVDADLRRKLEAACLQGPREIGAWLRGQRGTRDGVTIARRGKRWATWAT